MTNAPTALGLLTTRWIVCLNLHLPVKFKTGTNRLAGGDLSLSIRFLRGMKELLVLSLDALDSFEDCKNLCLAIGSLRGGESALNWLLYSYMLVQHFLADSQTVTDLRLPLSTTHRVQMRSDPGYMELERLPAWKTSEAKYEGMLSTLIHESETRTEG